MLWVCDGLLGLADVLVRFLERCSSGGVVALRFVCRWGEIRAFLGKEVVVQAMSAEGVRGRLLDVGVALDIAVCSLFWRLGCG